MLTPKPGNDNANAHPMRRGAYKWLLLLLPLLPLTSSAAEPAKAAAPVAAINLSLPVHQQKKLHPEISDPVTGDQRHCAGGRQQHQGLETTVLSSGDTYFVHDIQGNQVAGTDALVSDNVSGGADRVQGGLGDDQIDGMGGDDVLEGNDGKDSINGDGLVKIGLMNSVAGPSHGADFLDGGLGNFIAKVGTSGHKSRLLGLAMALAE